MVPTTGQPATASFDTKQPGRRPPSTGMSSQEEWLETYTTGRSRLTIGTPITRTRMPSSRATQDQ